MKNIEIVSQEFVKDTNTFNTLFKRLNKTWYGKKLKPTYFSIFSNLGGTEVSLYCTEKNIWDKRFPNLKAAVKSI